MKSPKYLCHVLTIKDTDDGIYTLSYFDKDSVAN